MPTAETAFVAARHRFRRIMLCKTARLCAFPHTRSILLNVQRKQHLMDSYVPAPFAPDTTTTQISFWPPTDDDVTGRVEPAGLRIVDVSPPGVH
ncbi:hypothetical protein CRI94_08020 [Longibacter salinarum]|uniref:Uncharacterized protein n=1 Tax=Longibacter salinarum TaxID=1850348 RepID=A0A2A8CZB8_9BACT|nr:hypothetical protein CRI94_08020 [Longibacter salinarum]